MLDEIVTKGGEWLMQHRANSFYLSGRSDNLLKLKPWQDAEATVVEILPRKGKFRGMMDSLLATDESGRSFRIGSGFSNKEQRNPPSYSNCQNLQNHRNHKERPAKMPVFYIFISSFTNMKAQLKQLALEHECNILK